MDFLKNIRGILLGEDVLIELLSATYGRRVLRVEVDQEDYKVCFDRSEDINAIVLGEEDLSKVLSKIYGRPISNIVTEGHDEYLIRFRT